MPKSQQTHFKLNRRSYCGTDRGENRATSVELTPNIEDVTRRSCLTRVKANQAALDEFFHSGKMPAKRPKKKAGKK